MTFPRPRRRLRSLRLLIHFSFSLLPLPQLLLQLGLLLHPPHGWRVVEPILTADRCSCNWNSSGTRHCDGCRIDRSKEKKYRWSKIQHNQTKKSKRCFFSGNKNKKLRVDMLLGGCLLEFESRVLERLGRRRIGNFDLYYLSWTKKKWRRKIKSWGDFISISSGIHSISNTIIYLNKKKIRGKK